MANETLPVVFKAKTHQSVAALSLGAFMIAYGLWHILGGDSEPVRVFNYGSVSASVAGWVFIAGGFLVFAGGLVSAIGGGCPILTVAQADITFKRCRGESVRLAWTDLAGIRSGRIPSLDRGQFSGVDELFLGV